MPRSVYVCYPIVDGLVKTKEPLVKYADCVGVIAGILSPSSYFSTCKSVWPRVWGLGFGFRVEGLGHKRVLQLSSPYMSPARPASE